MTLQKVFMNYSGNTASMRTFSCISLSNSKYNFTVGQLYIKIHVCSMRLSLLTSVWSMVMYFGKKYQQQRMYRATKIQCGT